ncbi:MAG: hypothetical protein RBT38_03360 [Bacteroidales bacterium]|jgi:hypothetical protein|nr:hypothetical protein [Bacteroidales bacterium]
MNHRLVIVTGLLVLFYSGTAAQESIGKRNYSRTLPAGKEVRLEVNNRYGSIIIDNWDLDSVMISATVEATAPDRAKMEKMLNGIDIDVHEEGTSVVAETLFDNEARVLLETFKGFTGKIINYNSTLEVNYQIKVPVRTDVKIRNQFGDISMGDNDGNVSINLSNGNFSAKSLNSISELSLDFGEAVIESLKSGKIITSFSKFRIAECEDLSVSSTSSDFNLRKVKDLHVNSRRDKFYIDKLQGIKGSSYFSEYYVGDMEGGADITLRFGQFEAEGIRNMDHHSYVTTNCDLSLEFDPSESFEFEIRHTNSFIVIPDRFRQERKTIDDERKEYQISGGTGRNKGLHEVRIEATRGNIHLR